MKTDIFAKQTKTIEVEVHSDFAERLVRARSKTKLTQAEIAKKIGKCRITITQYETGRGLPPLPVFVDLCRALNITPNELLGFKNQKNTYDCDCGICGCCNGTRTPPPPQTPGTHKWQHEETGRLVDLPEGKNPGPRWYRISDGRERYKGGKGR